MRPSSFQVVDFGCSTGQFFRYLKKMEHLRHFAAVDISYGCLEGACHVARPLVWDCIHKRAHSLTACFYRGSVAEQDPRLRGFDGVTCIELVEHLHEDDLKKLPGTIFGFVRPKVAVITTPNRDFNVVFPELRGMRHWDHKFEWSRAEFQSWCSGILDAYPGYSVEYTGVGDAPSGEFPGIGHCSQIAIFRKICNDKDLETSSAELPVYELRAVTRFLIRRVCCRACVSVLIVSLFDVRAAVCSSGMADVLWRDCADWLVRCQALPPDHRVTWGSAQLIDLANTLRDGVLLCQLLNKLLPGCVDLKEMSLRPQMSQVCALSLLFSLSRCGSPPHRPRVVSQRDGRRNPGGVPTFVRLLLIDFPPRGRSDEAVPKTLAFVARFTSFHASYASSLTIPPYEAESLELRLGSEPVLPPCNVGPSRGVLLCMRSKRALETVGALGKAYAVSATLPHKLRGALLVGSGETFPRSAFEAPLILLIR
ncbi:hypothetical protein HPB47_023588 [Ixodes persulcatus]|uniref:Uncharacterized protein n=1 Tax=Ixodes persulcatus TaxID=34615 RepID=A0AC60Q8Y3_IXOPE|nr:hypothetical protein HPB47_023588 [Ixodes persulcatus]